jgi:glutamine synthetase
LSPLEAADALVHTREIIRNITNKHGLRATFAPRPFVTSAGTGAHAHISIHSRSGESKPRESLASYETSFLAGDLEHLQALAALALPIPASFKRVEYGAFSGDSYVCWCAEKREVPICLVNALSPTSRRFEMRFSDATANPYLVLAGILTAGIDGIRKKQELTLKSCAGSPSEMSAEEREALGITGRLPLTTQEARTFFEQDEVFKKVFGDNFVTKYLSVNKVCSLCLVSRGANTNGLISCWEKYLRKVVARERSCRAWWSFSRATILIQFNLGFFLERSIQLTVVM